jgi:hypothetical protein
MTVPIHRKKIMSLILRGISKSEHDQLKKELGLALQDELRMIRPSAGRKCGKFAWGGVICASVHLHNLKPLTVDELKEIKTWVERLFESSSFIINLDDVCQSLTSNGKNTLSIKGQVVRHRPQSSRSSSSCIVAQ